MTLELDQQLSFASVMNAIMVQTKEGVLFAEDTEYQTHTTAKNAPYKKKIEVRYVKRYSFFVLDGCPKIVNLGSSRTDLFYQRRKYGFKTH